MIVYHRAFQSAAKLGKGRIIFTGEANLLLHAKRRIRLRRSLREVLQEPDKGSQVLDPEKGATLRDNDKRIGRQLVSPTDRKGFDVPFLILIKRSIFAPCLLARHQRKLLTVQRMERMSNAKSFVLMAWKDCIWRF